MTLGIILFVVALAGAVSVGTILGNI